MKRDKERFPVVRKYEPLLFWKPCKFCNKEFLREEGFIIQDLSLDRESVHTTYCCNDCASSISEVKDLLEQERQDFSIRRPAPPPKLKI